MPIKVGIIIANSVHFILPVSFFIVKQVVEHGKWHNENISTHIAVVIVQPLLTKIDLKLSKLSYSTKLPVAIYVISIIGITISLAGNPKIKEIKITPSIPINFPKGSKNNEIWFNNDKLLIWMFANNHIKAPAGIATITARPKTNNVRSKIERIITLIIWGFRYGGNSNVNEDGTPFNKVLDKI